MEVTLKRLSAVKFEAKNSKGQTAFIDGPPDMGGKEEGVRPMEMLLMSLAGCSAMDVVHILSKGRSTVSDLSISVKGDRADSVPSVFTNINVHFKASGDFSPEKLERAVELSMEKYCSVAKMLENTAKITHSCEFI